MGMKSLAPSSRLSISASLSPVMTMTGILPSSGSAFNVRRTSWPLMPGMCRSSNTREMMRLRALSVSMASMPSLHMTGVNSSSMSAARISRFISWSSTIMTSGFSSVWSKLSCSICMLTSLSGHWPRRHTPWSLLFCSIGKALSRPRARAQRSPGKAGKPGKSRLPPAQGRGLPAPFHPLAEVPRPGAQGRTGPA